MRNHWGFDVGPDWKPDLRALQPPPPAPGYERKHTVQVWGQPWEMGPDGRPQQLGDVDPIGAVTGSLKSLLDVGSNLYMSRLQTTIAKRQLSTQRDIAAGQQQTDRDIAIAEAQRSLERDRVWADRIPKIAVGVGLAAALTLTARAVSVRWSSR